MVEICPVGFGSSLKRVCAGRQHPLSSASDVEGASPVPDNDALNGSCEEAFEASDSTVSNAGAGSVILFYLQCIIDFAIMDKLFNNFVSKVLILEFSLKFMKIIYEVCRDAEKSSYLPSRIYLLKVNNKNTRTRCEICSKLTIKTPERRNWRGSGVFIVTFEHISHLVLVFLLLTLNMQLLAE